MKKLVLLSTGVGLVPRLVDIVKKLDPEIQICNLVDDTIVSSIAKNGNVVPTSIFARMCDYCRIAEDIGADAMLLTCSSISEAIDVARPLVNIPLFKIDEPMMEEAVRIADRKIGVAASLRTTLNPSCRQLEKKIWEAGKKITVVEGLCNGAFEAFSAGDVATHDTIVRETVVSLLESCDLVVLAQASMATAVSSLPPEQRQRVLSSPELGIRRVVSFLQDAGALA
ncbi:MAG: hypothetical protein IJQ02_11770 [Oscillospiraceae bacterium]|nr:hypothetical protein [Oscillospiraceae bacterium]